MLSHFTAVACVRLIIFPYSHISLSSSTFSNHTDCEWLTVSVWLDDWLWLTDSQSTRVSAVAVISGSLNLNVDQNILKHKDIYTVRFALILLHWTFNWFSNISCFSWYRCEAVYKECSQKIFDRGTLAGTANLLRKHCFYDMAVWEGILKYVL